jgi:hypothetical protein
VIAKSSSTTNAASIFRFGTIARPIEFKTSSAFLQKISRLTSGWPVRPWDGAAQKAVITVTRIEDGYTIASNWLDEPLAYADEADAACVFLVQLLATYAQSRHDLLLLHAGAATIAGKLIVFPAEGNIGKSTLTAVLAAKGCTIFSDDVLPLSLERGTGSALGIAPRPRLPLPKSLSAGTRAFIENHIGLGNDSFAYLALTFRDRPSLLAPCGAELPIGAFVIPDRIDGLRKPELTAASGAETMAQLIGQRIGKQQSPREMVEKLAALIGRVPCLRLSYASVEEAADFLLSRPAFAAQ